MSLKNRILVVGFGSDILTDDAISSSLVRDIELTNSNINVSFFTFLTSSMDMIETLCDYNSLIIIDSMKSNLNNVGELHKLSMYNVDDTIHLSNFHDHKFNEIIETAKRCGYNISSDIHIYGIEVKETHVFSSEFSKEIQNAYADLKSQIIGIIQKVLNEGSIEIEI